MFTVGTAARPCAQVHYSLSEKHLRRVRIDTLKHVDYMSVHIFCAKTFVLVLSKSYGNILPIEMLMFDDEH